MKVLKEILWWIVYELYILLLVLAFVFQFVTLPIQILIFSCIARERIHIKDFAKYAFEQLSENFKDLSDIF